MTDSSSDHPDTPEIDVLIIGAGLAGAAVAWHLGRTPGVRVVVLEQGTEPGRESSGHSAAIIRTDVEDPALAPYLDESIAALRAVPAARYRRTGGYLLGGARDADVAARIADARGAGTWHAAAGVVDPAGLLAFLLADVDVRTSVEVRGLRASSGESLTVDTSRGSFTASRVVNAAGAWAGAWSSLPLQPTNRHLAVTQPVAPEKRGGPWLWDEAQGYYMRPWGEARLLCGCDETPAEPGVTESDAEVLEALRHKVESAQPRWAPVVLAKHWVGQRTFAPDRRPVVGWEPKTPGLLHVAGLGGSGITLCMGLGRLAADILLGRREAPAALGITDRTARSS